ncbi:hypothetical protein EJ02DRAFT_428224 [Clathrospora elynae]|uniref:Uncharacterized protein n=1 Tax=Clathrospora elynae TaxID=706981 RepID=A0A6A5S7T2_9PLEO|nr:hypothetical protein EJ02DRAFT_428224 [Clathrospora elynae]
MNNLAFTWKAQGRSAEAIVLMRQCVQQRRRLIELGTLRLAETSKGYPSSTGVLQKCCLRKG